MLLLPFQHLPHPVRMIARPVLLGMNRTPKWERNPCKALSASLTTGTSTRTFFLKVVGSMSMCTIRALGANWDNFPVTRSSKRLQQPE